MYKRDNCNMRFGKLITINHLGKGLWRCRCDCGNFKDVKIGQLKAGRVKSCGCLKKGPYPCSSPFNERLYGIYQAMKERCCNKNNLSYPKYGGRGIKICDEWLNSWHIFRDWALSNGYSDDLTIDRIDFNGPYAPWNCRWTNKKVQANNTRYNVIIAANNMFYTMSEFSEKYNLPYRKVAYLVNKGHSGTEILDILCAD